MLKRAKTKFWKFWRIISNYNNYTTHNKSTHWKRCVLFILHIFTQIMEIIMEYMYETYTCEVMEIFVYNTQTQL